MLAFKCHQTKYIGHRKQGKHSLLFSVSVLIALFVRDPLSAQSDCHSQINGSAALDSLLRNRAGPRHPRGVGPTAAALAFTGKPSVPLCQSPDWPL